MNRSVAVALAVVFSATAATAQTVQNESPAAYSMLPAFSWSGAYIGVHGGVSKGNFGALRDGGANFSEWADEAIEEAQMLGFFAGIPTTVTPSFKRSKRNGFNAGAHFGYNFQQGNVVFGIEGDVSLVNSNVSAENTVRAVAPGRSDNTATAKDTVEVKWVSTVRGRVGFAQDRFLGYVTGGLAFGQVSYRRQETLALNFPAGSFFTSRSSTRSRTQFGYAVGAGAEFALTDNLALRGEYLYVDLGKGRAQGQRNIGTAFHQGRVGLNYRF